MIEIVDIEPSQSIEEAVTDWSLIEVHEVATAAKSAARSFARDYEGAVEAGDMEQELLIEFASRSSMVHEVLATMEKPIGVLTFRGYRLLRDKFKTQATHLRKNRSYEAELAKFNPAVD
ncbi:hypothetical protein AB0D08_00295 [Kitasatospora sp. NPDC048540]|uniref:hypothetical protein n=1 Tax=Kitasatospora sp. NPDC048540 TaxID=3155634 RepID=UPI0033E9FE19